ARLARDRLRACRGPGLRGARHRRATRRGARRGRRLARARCRRLGLDEPAGAHVRLGSVDAVRRAPRRRRRPAEHPLSVAAGDGRPNVKARALALALVIGTAGWSASLVPAQAAPAVHRLGPTPAGAPIDFDLVLRLRRAALDRYVAAVSDPRSPLYGRYL